MEKLKFVALLIESIMSIKDAMKKLNSTAEKILFVVDKKKNLLGTVTDGDIRRGLIRGLKFSDKVKKIMCVSFTFIRLEVTDKIALAERLMRENGIYHIPLLDRENRIVDVISWPDVFATHPLVKRKLQLSNQVVIMAGGKGERLEPFTKILPKALIPVGEKAVIEIIMEKFFCHGLDRFMFILNFKKEYIKLFLKENNFPYHIDWIEEADYLGTAGSLAFLKGRVTDTFFVSNCDIVTDVDYAQMLKMHKENGSLLTLVGCHKEVQIPYGILKMKNGNLKKILEKPNYDILINTGIYILEPKVLELIPGSKPLDMNHLISLVIKEGKVSVFPVYNGWFDFGQWEEYRKSFQELSKY